MAGAEGARSALLVRNGFMRRAKRAFRRRPLPAIDAAVTDPSLDVLAIGDAIVDVIATCDDSFLAAEGLVKGSMQVLDADGPTRLYAHMSQARETSGGSAANTMAGRRRDGRSAPASSARSPTTNSATSSPTTSAPSASSSRPRR